MKLVFKPGIALLLVSFLFTAVEASGQPQISDKSFISKQEFTKTIKKEFPISPDGTTSLTNKYGKIDVKTWQKNRVKIEVTILVKTASESKAQEVFDRINIDFSNSDDYVKAETSISSKRNSWFNWGNNKSEFEINYDVFMPKTGSLKLTNKYGDAFVSEIDGNADINVKYGSFNLEGVGDDLEVYLGYGAGTVVKARDVDATIAYSKIRFKETQDIDFSTKYSKIAVENATDIRTETRYDNYDLDEIREFKCDGSYGDVEISHADNIVANSKYTDFAIEKVGDSADFDLQYGGVTIDQIDKGFSKVELVGKYTNYKINVEKGASYVLEAEGTYAGIRYPSNLNVVYEKEKGSSHEVRGNQGGANARSVIKASLSYGGLRVRNND